VTEASETATARTLRRVSPLLVIVAFGLLWELSARGLDSLFFPPVSVVLVGFAERFFGDGLATLSFEFDRNLWPSMRRVGLGFLVATVVSIALGIALGSIELFARLVEPLVHFLRNIPPVTLIPLFLVLLGAGEQTIIVIIAVGASFPILLNTIHAIRNIAPTQLATAQVYGISPLRRLFYIRIPAAGPAIFAGLHIALAGALVLMVIAEMLAGSRGIGFSVLEAQRSFRAVEMWSGILVIGLLGNVFTIVLARIERRLLAWHRGMS
jgi:ABC-type nitrate/sulfonate/bicarbonate transport system permease component